MFTRKLLAFSAAARTWIHSRRWLGQAFVDQEITHSPGENCPSEDCKQCLRGNYSPFPLPLEPGFIVGAGWVRPLLTRTFTSTRRFSALPERVLLSAIGFDSPKPYGVTMRRSGIW